MVAREICEEISYIPGFPGLLLQDLSRNLGEARGIHLPVAEILEWGALLWTPGMHKLPGLYVPHFINTLNFVFLTR